MREDEWRVRTKCEGHIFLEVRGGIWEYVRGGSCAFCGCGFGFGLHVDITRVEVWR